MDIYKCPKTESRKKSWKPIISSLSYFEIYIIDHINTFTSNRLIYNFIFKVMNDNDVIINPIYHENTIHVTNAIFTNEPQTFAVAIQLEDVVESNNVIESDDIIEPVTTILTFKNFMGCFTFLCYGSLCCFSLFILMGGIGLFLTN